jgi:glyoxylase-like metal-dependent hydrolase (beta-lactamase superfamily II)
LVGPYRHFAIEALADGVWAALHRTDPPAPDAWAVCNAGIVDLGDRTIVFDAFMTTAAATELRDAAEALTGRPPDLLVLSHAHNDHAWGIASFPGVPVISSAAARAELVAEGPAERAMYQGVLTERLAHWEAAAVSDDALLRRDAAFFLPYWQGVEATLPGLELRLPDQAIDGRLEIHGSGRRVEVVPAGRAHAAGDVVLHLPDDAIAFAGDVFFVRCHPYLGDGDIGTLRTALERLAGSGTSRIVPGHGPVGGIEELRTLARYLDDVERLAAQGPEAPIPDAYGAWGLRPFFPDNLEFAAAGGHQAGLGTG